MKKQRMSWESNLKGKCLVQRSRKRTIKDLWRNTGGPERLGTTRDHTKLAVADPERIRQTYKL